MQFGLCMTNGFIIVVATSQNNTKCKEVKQRFQVTKFMDLNCKTAHEVAFEFIRMMLHIIEWHDCVNSTMLLLARKQPLSGKTLTSQGFPEILKSVRS